MVNGDEQYCDQQDDISTYKCSDLVNKINCLQITTEGEMCEFDDICKVYEPAEADDCISPKYVNPFVCVKITK